MTFSPKQFRESLQQSGKIGQRFEKYLGECRKSNTEALYCIVEEFLRIFSDKESLLLKVNALFALTLCVETCEYAIVELTEAFLLPVLQEAALYQCDKRTYAKTAQFFRDKGYPPSTPSIDQLSHNFVSMATDLVFLAAAVKPHCYFFTDRLNLPSAYRQLADRLEQKGNEPPARITDRAEELQQLYEGNLFEFENHEEAYVQFFKKRLSRFLLEGGRGRDALDIRKLLKNNDSWLTSEIIGSLSDALEDDNFTVRRHALGLLNELFVWGDVEAIMIVNEGEAVERVYQRILEVKGSSDLGRGAQIYPEIKGQLEQKKAFYVDFLRCLDTWGKLAPTAIYLNRDEQSKVSKLYRALTDKNFIFPTNDMLVKFSKQYEENMKRNLERNNYIITQLNDGDTSKNRSVASHRLSKYSQKISLIREMRESTILSLPEIEKLVEEAEMTLRNVTKVERELTKNMKTLKYFLEEFEKKFCLLEESVTESHLESLYERGCKCSEKIAEIEPYYQDYLQGRVDFKRFGELLGARLSQLDHSKSKSRFSDVLSKLSRSKNSLSRDHADLSRSLHATKGKEAALARQDHVLERSGDVSQFSRTQNNLTRTANNASSISEKSPKHSQLSKGSVLQQKKEEVLVKEPSVHAKLQSSASKLSREEHKNSASFSRESVRSTEKEKSPATAKFLLDDNDQSRQKEESLISKGSSKREKGSQASSRANPYNKNTPSYPQPSERKREQFSDNSEWQSSEEEAPKQKPAPPQPSINAHSTTKNKLGQSKSRQVFSDGSFSEYDQSNEEIRQAIDKSENPDFKLLFKDKSMQPNPSQHSKLSKPSKLYSQEHYAAVLESLAAKSNQNEKSLSKLSRDKSASQLPPRSQYDHNSKIDQRNYQAAQNDSSESMNGPVAKGGSKLSRPSNDLQAGPDSNSMYPPEKQKSSSIKPSQSFQLSPPPSSLVKDQQPSKDPSKISSEGSEFPSSLSKVKSEENFKKKGSRMEQGRTERREGNEVQLSSIKQQKMNEIKQLQKRIQFLKSQEKHLHVLRSDWQSPTRPQTLRTALSPRFRNNNTSAPTNQALTYTDSNTNNSQRQPQRQRAEEMNFDVIELFKPPEGRLVYSRLYRKELGQLDVRERRKILKGKDLAFRNDDVEIGLMVHRDANDLKVIYYVTPSRFLKTFLFKLEPSPKLAVHAIPGELANLEPLKQYRIYLFAEVLEFPYRMPVLQFKYHPELLDIQEKLFLTNEVNYFTSIVPFFFTKFLTMRPTTLEAIQQAWPAGVLRGEETPYSKKLLPRHFYILQYFPDMVNLESTDYETWYGAECEYGSTRFLLKVVLKINKFMYIQGVLTEFRDKANSERIMEYTICCINQLLSKTHKEIAL